MKFSSESSTMPKGKQAKNNSPGWSDSIFSNLTTMRAKILVAYFWPQIAKNV